MYRTLLSLIIMMVILQGSAAEPFCNVTTYGYRDGVPAATGSRTVQDQHGFMWIATWNGLYRYDGYEFRPIRPDVDNDVRRYSSRFRDIKMGPEGMMWCRVDDNIVLFDVDTYRFHDLHSRIETYLGEKVKIGKAIRETADGDIVLNTFDGRVLVFDAHMLRKGEDPIDAMSVLSGNEPIKLKSAGFHRAPLPSAFDRKDVAFSTKDGEGNIWVVCKDGRILTGSSPDGAFKEMTRIDTDGSAIKFSCEDNQGNLWMISKGGIHKIALGTSPLTYIAAPSPSQLRTSMTDRQGRIWMAWSDSGYVTVSSDANSDPLYLSPDGRLSANPVKLGIPVYSMAEGADGGLWLGSKPEGLFRLAPLSEDVAPGHRAAAGGTPLDGYAVSGPGNYYDLAFDGQGRLWMATLGNGIEVMPNPSDPNPAIIPLIDLKGYPQEADKVRRVRIIGDSLIVATTTEGLLSFPMPDHPATDDIDFRLHRSEPGDGHALGNIATMDALATKDASLYIATESDGVNVLTSPLSTDKDAKWEFCGNRIQLPAMAETALSLGELPDGRIIVVGKQDVNILNPAAGGDDIEVLGPSFWKRNPVFNEGSPLRMPDGRWLIGLSDGAVAADLEKGVAGDDSFPIVFTSYNIEGGPAIALSPLNDTIMLTPKERAMTLTFAALCYSDANTVRYAYRMGDSEEWIPIGALRTLTFTRLEPGTHRVSVRSTDLTGRWLDNTQTITIDVKPTFWETGWAKLLYVLATLSLIGGGLWLWLYTREMKRKQKETLEAYLSLLEARATAEITLEGPGADKESADHTAPSAPSEPELKVRISSEDRDLISQVIVFIDRNFADSSITVDDMANAVAVSKSSLTRKMKSLMGVTPADFLKTTRLSKSKVMLKETDCSIKEIAIDCGFSDMNYFGKCFKAAYGATPSAWRSGES